MTIRDAILRPPRHAAALLAAAILLTALAFGCGGGGGDDGGDGGGLTVNVLLQEWTVVPDVESAPVGKVTFAAINAGSIPHTFFVAKTDLAPDALATDDEGVVDVEGEGIALIDELAEIEPTGSDEVTLDLAPGKYVLFCNLPPEETMHGGHPSHYAQGMSAAFTVE
jgi:uncharacterized cupredoxin-like copper-binding protein